jgi:hypothetical protein
MLKVELYSFTPSEFIITTLNHLITHFLIYTFEKVNFRCNGQKLGYFQDVLFKWTKFRLYL